MAEVNLEVLESRHLMWFYRVALVNFGVSEHKTVWGMANA